MVAPVDEDVTRPSTASSPSPDELQRITLRRILLVALIVAGCAGPAETGEEDVISWRQYVEVSVALRQAQRAEDEPRRFDATRDSILSAHGTSPAALRRFVEHHGDDPAFMAGVWTEIESRLAADQDTTG